MIIKQTSVNIVHPRLVDYRRRFVAVEDVLKNSFLTANILPIPDEVQEDIPRIIAQTKGGHSLLNIALNVTSFNTTYNNDYVNNWIKCKEYLYRRCSDVYKIVNEMTETNFFVGLIANLYYDDLDKDGIEIIKNSLFGEKIKELGDPGDISTRLTYFYKDKYYVNITIENVRPFQFSEDNKNHPIVTNPDCKNDVAVTIDVNDRFAMNFDENYKSNEREFNNILSTATDIIENKLSNLIYNGVYINE